MAGIVVMLAWGLVDRWTRQLVGQWRAGDHDADRQLSLAVVFVVCAVTLVWGFPAGVGAGVLVSMAMQAPCPRLGVIGWLASPSMVTRPAPQCLSLIHI